MQFTNMTVHPIGVLQPEQQNRSMDKCKGRTLTKDDLAHYQKIVIALSETRLMAEIDRVIETHGGWPGAFQVSADEVAK